MFKFTKIAAPALIAAMAFGAAVPAQAQNYGQHNQGRDYGYNHNNNGYNNGQGIEREITQLERQVNRGDNRDRISEREAAGLRRDVAQLRWTYRSYARNGLSSSEVRTLQNRIQNIRHRLQNERNDRDGRRY
ncbi:hypothetical protein [Novosphingobium sp.]|uniref:hypothetical protein n=1 Tax=Novosphingobium sp. TaxID=1874826 RepID=UPI00286E26FA|nr:hypothetical protein [Novosphingobium sp.]